jgi:hypothetical protein
MDKLDQAIAVLKAENKRLQTELKAVRAAIAALQRGGRNGHDRTMSASARRKIAAAQRTRWAKWRARRKN